MTTSQEYRGQTIDSNFKQSAFPTANGAFYLAQFTWHVGNRTFDTLAAAKSYIGANFGVPFK